MNILLIDSALPSSPFSGKTVRLKNIYGRLAKDNKVYFLKTNSEDSRNEISKEIEGWAENTFSGIKSLAFTPSPNFLNKLRTAARFKPWFDVESKFPERVGEIKSELKAIAAEWQIDLVISLDNEVAQHGTFLSGSIPWIQDIGDSMIVQAKRQAEFARDWKKRFNLVWRLMRETRFERGMVSKACATIFVANDDASLYAKQNGKIHVIPNGVDSNYFDPGIVAPLKMDDPYVVFTGHMSFQPNQDAVKYFAKFIFPLLKVKMPEIKFVIVGADPSEEVLRLGADPSVLVTGKVPDIRPYLAGALAFVCPMRMGSGIKNKILEALSMKLPVVATPLALAGISRLPPETVVSASGSSEFLAELNRVLRDENLRIRMGEEGRKFVLENYSWDTTVNSYKKFFSSLVSKGRAL